MQSQLAHCRAYLAAHRSPEEAQSAWIYEDEGFSGAVLRRPAMQRLLRDIRAGRIHCVVCYRLDRISRSVSDFTALMDEFSRYGVSFLCAAESFDTEKPMGRAMLYIASVFSQLERETIAERVRDNMYTLAADGRWLGGPPPYGYRIVRTPPPHPHSYLAADETEFPIVQAIFEVYLRHGDMGETQRLVSHMIQGHRRQFTRRFLRDMLQNPVYAAADSASAAQLAAMGCKIAFAPQRVCHRGCMVFGRHPNRRRAENGMIAAMGQHPPVCSGAQWQYICRTLHREIPTAERAPVGLLRHLLRCGRCGELMQCKRRSGREGQYDYLCRKKARMHQCDCANLCGGAADSAVWERIAGAHPVPEGVQKLSFAGKLAFTELVVQSAVWDGEILTLTLRR